VSGRGAHRRPSTAQRLAAATGDLAQLRAELAGERELRRLADGLMGRLVEDRELALEHARRMQQQAVQDREYLHQSRRLVADLRRQAADPHPTGAAERTQPIPVVVPLGSPHWQHSQDIADLTAAAHATPSWARTA